MGIPKEHKKQENVLNYLYDFCKNREYNVSIIEDNGLTEFSGNKTKTALCVGPFDVSDDKLFTVK